MFNIKVPIPSSKEAFDMLAIQIKKLDWFMANGRSYRLEYYQELDDPLINEMISNRNMDQITFYDKYQQQFEEKLYKKELYDKRISQIEEAILKLQSCYNRFNDLRSHWGFEILPVYYIDINLYGCGGSYHKDKQGNGHVTIGTTKDSTDYLAFLIGHEVVHLGIEDLIINPNHEKEELIKQDEKERIVDNLCIYTMGDLVPGRRLKNGQKSKYQEITMHADYMDEVVGQQPENNLVSSIQEFLKKKGLS